MSENNEQNVPGTEMPEAKNVIQKEPKTPLKQPSVWTEVLDQSIEQLREKAKLSMEKLPGNSRKK